MKAEDGMDVRNYGGLDGIPEAKKLIADILEVKPENVIVCRKPAEPSCMIPYPGL